MNRRSLTLATVTVLLGVLSLGVWQWYSRSFSGTTATIAEELERLKQEYEELRVSNNQKITAANEDRAKRDEQFQSYRQELQAISDQLLRLAKRHRREPAAVDALVMLAQIRSFEPSAEDALQRLGKYHVDSDRLAWACQHLIEVYGDRFQPLEDFLRTVREKSPHRDARGAASLALAVYLRKLIDHKARDVLRRSLAKSGTGSNYGPPHIESPLDVERAHEESQRLLEEVVEQYGDVAAIHRGTLGQVAQRQLFELQSLATGTASEIVGEDLDGTEFKLSDYRGKVVLLDFWGNW